MRSHDRRAHTHTDLPNRLSSRGRALFVVLKPTRPISISFPSADTGDWLTGQPVLSPRKETREGTGRRYGKRGKERKRRDSCTQRPEVTLRSSRMQQKKKKISRLDVRSGLLCRRSRHRGALAAQSDLPLQGWQVLTQWQLQDWVSFKHY